MTETDSDAARLLERLTQTLPAATFRPLGPAYLEEPRGRFQGQAAGVVAPSTVDEVALIVRAASDAAVPVVPYGGGTGLVGGQIKPDGAAPIVLSLERMRAIRAVYPDENILISEAGATLHEVRMAAEAAGLLFPLSLASEGSCRIGGNLATNAGGVNVLRYGNARDLCLGLEAVLPDGSIWHGLKRLRKDNTGYDLRNLLIGSEGTLGIITAASLRLYQRPASDAVAYFVVDSPSNALALLHLFHDRVGEGVSAFELIHGQGMAFLTETMPELRLPFGTPPEWSVLVELGLHGDQSAQDAMLEVFEIALEKGLVTDGVIAESVGQKQAFWAVRETIPEGNSRIGAISSHDVSVPLGALAEFISEGFQLVEGLGPFRVNCFGHMGDGNLHFNVFPPKGGKKSDYVGQRDQIMQAIHDLVHQHGGSVSAEHGIGRLKVGELERYGDPARLAAMRAIKTALDPQGIMNPGAVLRG
ncbi:FAD-binding oxidoreductase [Pseudoruegeria sp. SK021]|uniref:FAD-binding oxidoreductase n=1 Tax=Pseudoruegeria sp. SK021 TaxID=1933035 RepID=UPI000A2365B0|nr:hydroxyacid dehydrogenase [Pseudoruegeria sp. SK021]